MKHLGKTLPFRGRHGEPVPGTAMPPTRGFYDECMKGDGGMYSLGFMKPTPIWPFGNPGSFGAPGAGGSLGYADPTAGIG